MHDAEAYTSPLIQQTSSYGRVGGRTWTEQTQYGGEALESGRAASVHTEVDDFGWRNPTPYSAYRRTDRRPITSYSYKDKSNNTYFGTNHVHNPLLALVVDQAILTQLKAEAETLALGKFGTGAVDLSVAFLERKQTVGMVTEWCTSATRMLQDLRKGRWVKHFKTKSTKTWKWDKNVPRGWTPKALQQWRAGEAITTLPNAWLTTRYGIAPSLMDIAGSVEALERADNGTFERYIITNQSRRFAVESWVESQVDAYYGRYVVLPVKTWRTHFRKYEVKVRLDATIDDSFYLSLQDVGLTNPLLSGWEVIPYSFVMDWFVGVGDFLSAVNAFTTGYSFKAGSCTQYHDLSSDGYVTIDEDRCASANNLEPTLTMPFSARKRDEGFTRTVYSAPPFPTLVVKRDPLSFERMWDSIFLLSNLIGNKGAASKAKDRMRNLRI